MLCGTKYHISGDEDSGSMADSNELDWKSYIQRAKLYFIANNIKDSAKQKLYSAPNNLGMSN